MADLTFSANLLPATTAGQNLGSSSNRFNTFLRIPAADYGSMLPESGSEGQVFFQLSNAQYELPAGGSTNQALIKSDNVDRNVSWGGPYVNLSGDTMTGDLIAPKVYGAVWNDYAEYRKDNLEEVQEPGRCVYELGDGRLALTKERLMRGCEIISDTFGFAIGQDKENGYNTPIASSGRVLAYPYETREEFTKHIGYFVCSGPNGTVSLMNDIEACMYPWAIVGTVSEIPDYIVWGTGQVKVNGRIWIRIK